MTKKQMTQAEIEWWMKTNQLPDWVRPEKKEKSWKSRGRVDSRTNRVDTRDRKGRVDDRDRSDREKLPFIFVGIDGEGITDEYGIHRYNYMAMVTEKGQCLKYLEASKPTGLTTDECLQYITSVPRRCKLFAYAFGYDLTKILADVDDVNLYKLLRPELRRRLKDGRKVHIPVWWPHVNPRWSLDYMNGQLTVKRRVVNRYAPGKITFETRGTTINDIWKFFQGKFTSALEDWKVPRERTPQERSDILTAMREMKDQRGNFNKLSSESIAAYCQSECAFMGELARHLTDAHVEAGLILKSYFGAGSTASAMLDKMGIRKHIEQSRETLIIPDELEHAIACAFSGGRFENSVVGPVNEELYSWDISSAYPYHITFLPCLVHGKWELTRDRKVMESAKAAVINYKLGVTSTKLAWGPFPYRFPKGHKEQGNICYPRSGHTGWVWRDEYLAGEKLFPNVHFLSAWVYHCDCQCQPFAAIPSYYKERLRIGKEGVGIVFKLGPNSCYGKTAQAIGGEVGPFTSWIWAGLITSGCRAQILQVMALHKNLDNLLMIATDGIVTREQLNMPIPWNTDTGWCPSGEAPSASDLQESGHMWKQGDKGWLVNKPLGGWEGKKLSKGVFFARPGIYFPNMPTENEIKKVRARGIGRACVYENYQRIIDAYHEGAERVHIKDLTRFIGAKTAITRSGHAPNWMYKRSESYGQWVLRPVDLSFAPGPKRAGVIPSVKVSYGKLTLRNVEGESAPYNKSLMSEETKALQTLQDELNEQPDGGDYAEWLDL